MPALFLAIAELNEPSGDFEVPPSFFFTLLGIGVLITVLGHLTRTRALVGAGLVLIFLGTVLLPVGLYLGS